MSSPKCVAVVTGANKGIGLAIVRALCKKYDGAVYLTSRDQKRGEDAVKTLEGEGLKPQFHLLDVANQSSLHVLKEYMVKTYGGVDVFVHNAAIMFHSRDNVPFAEQAHVSVAVNFESTRSVCNTFLPVMKPNGRFVNLSSGLCMSSLRSCSEQNQNFFKSDDLTEEALSAKLDEFVKAAETDQHVTKGFANNAYGISKVGVTSFTRILGKRARLLKAPNVLVNCCCPGWVRTDLGGPKAHLSPDQGAEIPVMLALLPPDVTEPNGEFMKDNKVIKWY